MKQGAKANKSGDSFENMIETICQNAGFRTSSPDRYKAIWHGGVKSTGNLPDKQILMQDKKVIIECKNQNVSGTVDQKGPAELYNAAKRIKCDHYILVYGGTWWEKGRGKNIFEACKEFAAEMSQHSGTFLKAANNLHVIRSNELIGLLKEIKSNG